MHYKGSFRDLKVWRDSMALVEDAFLHYLDIALGSQGEVEVPLEISLRLGFVSQADYEPVAQRAEEVGRMLNGLNIAYRPSGLEDLQTLE